MFRGEPESPRGIRSLDMRLSLKISLIVLKNEEHILVEPDASLVELIGRRIALTKSPEVELETGTNPLSRFERRPA